MRPVCVIHAIWCHFILVSSTSFSQVPWSVLWLRHQFVTDVTAWLINPNPSCSKNRKLKEKKTKNRIQEKEKIKTEFTVNDLDTEIQIKPGSLFIKLAIWLWMMTLVSRYMLYSHNFGGLEINKKRILVKVLVRANFQTEDYRVSTSFINQVYS